MKKQRRQLLSMLMALLMIFTMLPIPALAEEAAPAISGEQLPEWVEEEAEPSSDVSGESTEAAETAEAMEEAEDLPEEPTAALTEDTTEEPESSAEYDESTWCYNEVAHWHPAIDSENEGSVREAHSLEAGSCTACGYSIASASPAEADQDADAQTNIQNGSFEAPALTKNSSSHSKEPQQNVPAWNTTATDGRIEIAYMYNGTSKHMTATTTSAAADGNQFAELIANEIGSIYQRVTLEENVNFTWSLSHRGRDGEDVAVVAFTAYNSSIRYDKTNAAQNDHLRQIISWIQAEVSEDPSFFSFHTDGHWGKLEIYSTALQSDMTFDEPSDGSGCFALSPDDEHSVKWILYLIKSDKACWYSYKDILPNTLGSNDVMMLMSSYSTASAKATSGNLVDAVSLIQDGVEKLTNGGFDDYAINVKYKSLSSANANSPTAGIGWSATTYERKIEIGNLIYGNAYGITGTTIPISVPDGEQFAELNAEEESSLYQLVDTVPGTLYQWSLSHRGRFGQDVMALIIGPAQSYSPKKISSDARDQLMQIVDWVKSRNYTIGKGCSSSFRIYTPPFNDNGGFEATGDGSDTFRSERDDYHTQCWTIWIISSDRDQWYRYGDSEVTKTGLNHYIAPEGAQKSIIGFVSYSSTIPAGTDLGDKPEASFGNLIDWVDFQELHRFTVELGANSGGSTTTVTGPEGIVYDSPSDLTKGYLPNDSTINISVTPGAEKSFAGIVVNDTWIPYIQEDTCWSYRDGCYSYTLDHVTRALTIKVLYREENTVTYDPGDGTNGSCVSFSDGVTHEASQEPAPWLAEGQSFQGWRFIAYGAYGSPTITMNGITRSLSEAELLLLPAEHTVSCYEDETGTLKFRICYRNSSGDEVTIENIPTEDGLTLFAQWAYRYLFTAEMTEGEITDNPISVTPAGGYTSNAVSNGQEVWLTADATQMIVSAAVIENYLFKGWYYGNIRISTNRTIQITGALGVADAFVARYAPKGETHDLTIRAVTNGDGCEIDKVFTVYLALRGLEDGKEYRISQSTTELTGLENPQSITADAEGNALCTLQMKNGSALTLEGLPEGSDCEVTEQYESVYQLTVSKEDESITGNKKVTVTNHYELSTATMVAYILRNGNRRIYADIYSALADAREGETIVLLKDISVLEPLVIDGMSLNLDLGGKQLTMTDPNAYAIMYSNAAGTVSGGSIVSGKAAVYVGSGAEVITENLTVSQTKAEEAVSLYDHAALAVGSGGNLTVLSGSYSGDHAVYAAGGSLLIENGSFSGSDQVLSITNDANARVLQGKYAGDISVDSSASLCLEGGYYTISPDETYVIEGKNVIDTPEGTERTEGYLYTIGTKQAQYCILSLSHAEGSDVGVLTGGGRYQSGILVTATASYVDGWSFEGWYEDGNKVSSAQSYSFVISGDRTLYARYVAEDTKYSLTVLSGSGSVTCQINEESAQSLDAGSKDQTISIQNGYRVTVNAIAAVGDGVFGGWYDEQNNLLSSGRSYSFTMTADRQVKAVYLAPADNQALVVFDTQIEEPSNGALSNQVLSAKQYQTSMVGNAAEEQPTAPSYLGYRFTGFTVSVNNGKQQVEANHKGHLPSDNLKQAINSAETNSVVTVTANYERSAVTFRIRLNFVDGEGNELSASRILDNAYTVGDAVVVWAVQEITKGETTYHLSSYQFMEQTFTGAEKITIWPTANQISDGVVDVTAVYSREETAAQANVSIMNAYRETVSQVNKIAVTMSYAVPESWTLVEAGFYYGWTNETTAKYVINTDKNDGVFTLHAAVGQYVSYPAYFKAFVTYIDAAGNQNTICSETVCYIWNDLSYADAAAAN